MLDARRTDIDANHASRRLAQGMLGRLRCTTAGDQNAQILSIRLIRPMQMVIGTTSFPILPVPTILIQALDRRRIGSPVIKALYRYTYHSIRPSTMPASIMSISRAAAGEISMMALTCAGIRSFIVTVVRLPLKRLMTVTIVPNGKFL